MSDRFCCRCEDEHRPEEARVWAAARYPRVIVSKVWNNRYMDRMATESFAAEAYRLAGYPELYGKSPIVFDRRSPEREAKLAEQASERASGPFILYNLDGSSSPFRKRRRSVFARWLRWQRLRGNAGEIRRERAIVSMPSLTICWGSTSAPIC